MSKEWKDYILLSTSFTAGISSAGKGLWGANPNLAKNLAYIHKLNQQSEQYVDNKLSKNNTILQEKYDLLKKMVKKVTQIFRRNGYILRAGKRWIESNEKFPGYLKRAAESRAIKRNIPKIFLPETGLECLNINAKLDAASNFYSTLYSAESIDRHDLESMLNMIDKQVSSNDNKHIVSNSSFDDILDGLKKTPHKSSPGMDDLLHEILA